jgi:DNA-binding transcriptional MocR family regulator
MPSATNPTVGTMSEERRHALAGIVRRFDIHVIENDACGPLTEDCPPAIAAIAPEHTFHISSFTKCVMPGPFSNRHLVTNWMATALVSEVAARWVEDGTAWELLLWHRSALKQRHRVAA